MIGSSNTLWTCQVCLSSVSSDQLEPSAPPWPALASRRETNCHCYQENCHYFSFRDAIKLSWHSASQFCACLGGSLARQEGDSSSALSYYTLGLVAGTGSQSGQPSRESDKINNCQNYLQCLQNYQVRDHSQGTGRDGGQTETECFRNDLLTVVLPHSE